MSQHGHHLICKIIRTRAHAALAVVAAILMSLASTVATAQAYPNRPVRIVIPFTPASAMDHIVRTMSDRMSAVLGQPIIAEFKPGGGTVIGAQYVRNQPPDGYTIFIGSNSIAIKSAVPNAVIDARTDLEPIAVVDYAPLVIAVNAEQVKARSLKELIEYARSRPGQLNYATYGIGSLPHLTTELLLARTGARMTHIPFQGPSQAAADIAAGRTQFGLNVLSNLTPFVTGSGGGKIRLLGVTTTDRARIMPDLPGMKESGYPDLDYRAWSGLFAPKGTPRSVIDKLNLAANEALKEERTHEVFARLGMWAVVGSTPAELAAVVSREIAAYQEIIRSANLTID